MEILAEPPTIPGTVFESREIPSNVQLVIPLVTRLADRLLEERCLGEEDRRKIELCLNEAITNAVTHGNDSDFSKEVSIQLFRDGDRWGTVITDEGEGFSLHEVPDAEAEENLWQESGRGIALLQHFMDEVSYFDGGRTLVMVRSCLQD